MSELDKEKVEKYLDKKEVTTCKESYGNFDHESISYVDVKKETSKKQEGEMA